MDKQTSHLIFAIKKLKQCVDILSASATSPSPMSHFDSEEVRKLRDDADRHLESAVMVALEADDS